MHKEINSVSTLQADNNKNASIILAQSSVNPFEDQRISVPRMRNSDSLYENFDMPDEELLRLKKEQFLHEQSLNTGKGSIISIVENEHAQYSKPHMITVENQSEYTVSTQSRRNNIS